MAQAKLAYLLAASHSGSTLLAMLLGAQEQACSVGELKAASLGGSNYRCSCKSPIVDCPFWKSISSRMATHGIEFDIIDAGTNIFDVRSGYARKLLCPLHRGAILEVLRDAALSLSREWSAHLAETQRRNAALIKSLLDQTGTQIIIDSSKSALRLKYLLQNPELEVKVIRIIRDGRAVSLTYMDDWNFADSNDPSMRNGGTGRYRPSVQSSMQAAANEWRRSNEAADALLSSLPPSQFTQIHYEDLCASPKRTLAQLLSFVGLNPDRVNLNFRSREQHIIGNGMRMDTTSEIKLDERWKTHLSKEDLAVFDRVGGVLNRRYGYI